MTYPNRYPPPGPKLCTGCEELKPYRMFRIRKDGSATAWCLRCLREVEPDPRRGSAKAKTKEGAR